MVLVASDVRGKRMPQTSLVASRETSLLMALLARAASDRLRREAEIRGSDLPSQVPERIGSTTSFRKSQEAFHLVRVQER